MIYYARSTVKIFWSIFAILTAACSWTASAKPLDNELRKLLETSPRIQAASMATQAAQREVNVAKSDFLPIVYFRADLGPEFIDTPQSRRFHSTGRSDLIRKTAGLGITQQLFSGHRRASNFAAAQIGAQIADLNHKYTTQDIIHAGCAAYIDVLVQSKLVKLAIENQQVIQTQMGLENERVTRGSGMAVDVLLAKARLQLASERLIAFKGDLQAAQIHYKRIFGHEPGIRNMSYVSNLSVALPKLLEDGMTQALSANVDLLVATLQLELAEKERKSIAADRWPVIDLVGTIRSENDYAAREGQGDEYSVLLTANWSLFAGLRTYSKERVAIAQREKHRFVVMDMQRRIEEDVERAFDALETARRRAEMLQNAYTISEEIFSARVALRKAGKDTAINVLDARSETFQARINLYRAEADSHLAELKLLLAMGRLTPATVGI